MVLQGGARGKVSEDEIKSYCRKQLAEYKVPHIVDFHGELSEMDVGKVHRAGPPGELGLRLPEERLIRGRRRDCAVIV